MGDVNDGGAELSVQLDELGAHRRPELGIEIRERLVEEEGLGLPHQRLAKGHALALPARQFARFAAKQLADTQRLGNAGDPAVDFIVPDSSQLQAEGEI